jgi:hypothetical protein
VDGHARVFVEFFNFTSHAGKDFHLFVGREVGVCKRANDSLDLGIRASRLFVRRDVAWRQVKHHGSIKEPKLIADIPAK